MADATVARNPQPHPSAETLPLTTLKAKASTSYYAGTMQTANSAGRAANPTSTSEIVAGVVVQNVDNSAGANDAKNVELRTGPHWFALHVTNPPTVADLYKHVYASDNQTISNDPTDGSLAGILLAVETTQCCVWVGPPASAPRGDVSITADALVDNTGGAAGDATLAAMPTIVTLTDSTGYSATHDDTLAATTIPTITATNPAAPTAYAAVVNMSEPVAKAEGEAVSAALATLRSEVATYETAISALVVDVAAILAVLAVMAQNDSDMAQKIIQINASLLTARDNIADIAAVYNDLHTNLTA